MKIGTTIKRIRKIRGYKQNEFANLCGISQTYLSLIESNSKEPNLSTLRKISEALSLPLSVLFFFSLDEKDVDNTKKELYNRFYPSIKNLMMEIFTSNDKI